MMATEPKPRVLYVVYWGAAEPLGRSLVLPAVKELASLGADLTLVTFEKPVDFKQRDVMAGIKGSLDECDVRWVPLRYHKRPKLPATAFDFAHGVARSIASALGARPDIIHARTFIGGLMGMALRPVIGAKLIYHNEGFYPDEQVDAGVWRAGSRPHRAAKSLENRMYSRADAIIALSNRAKEVIEKLEDVRRKATPVIKVPSCVDLDDFQTSMSSPPDGPDMLRFVYAGNIGGRYRFEEIARFVSAASRRMGRVHLRVLTAAEPKVASSILRASGLPEGSWSIDKVSREAIPAELARADVGFNFLEQGISEHGGSPTKIGEYWAAGLPVISTPNVSDTDEIIRRERVGVIVGNHSDDGHSRAIEELRALLLDPDLGHRCRKAAENHYALKPACERQFALYQQLASSRRKSTARARVSESGESRVNIS